MQCTVLNGKPSSLSGVCLAPRLVMPFLSNSLKALVMETVTNGFPSVTLVLQHLVFKISFHQLFTAPSSSPGGDEKVILIFQRRPVNYSIGLCIAYSLHSSLQCTGFSLWWLRLLTEHRLSMLGLNCCGTRAQLLSM